MMRNFIIRLTLLSLLPLQGASATTSTGSDEALDAGLRDNAQTARAPAITAIPVEPPVTTVRVVAPPPVPDRTQSANPLWAIPLTQLPVTGERPIFSPSRRPPPAAFAAEPTIVKAPPVRKKEPEAPQLALVGTIASDEEGFGIFVDQSTKAALRLKVGESYQGWELRAIRGREVTMEKDQQAVTLVLPQPTATLQGGEARLLPVSADKTPLGGRR